ncbi:MAG: methyltransferase domain-containing protein [Chlamydiota bacterium]
MSGASKSDWYLDWFNEDYLNLYAHRGEEEAKKHINFLCHHLNLTGHEKILDLCCGSGRHAILLGKLGYHVTGVDTSNFLIEKAIANSKDVDAVKFLCRDMRDIRNLGHFEVILSMFTSFGYFESNKQNLEVLHTIFESLTDGGLFFMDYLNVPHVYQNLKADDQLVVNGEKVSISRQIVGDKVIKTIDFPGRSYCESVKLYDPTTISEMLKKAGFSIITQWGNYEAESLSPLSERVLTLATIHKS